MNEITEGKFPEVRSRQEMYLQDIIKSLSNESISDNNYPDPLSRQEAYLQIIISKLRANDPNIEINTEDIEKAVNKYLEQNPIQPGATENQAQQIEENKKDVASLKAETGSLKEDIGNVLSNNIFDVSKCIKGKAYATTYNVSTLEDFVDNEKAYSVPAITLPHDGKITVNQKFNWSSFVAYLYMNNIYQGYITPVQNDNGTWTFTNNIDGCNKIAFTILSDTADFDISKFMVVIGDYDKMPDIYEPSGLKAPEKSIQFDALTIIVSTK